jgi:hypothetical protein
MNEIEKCPHCKSMLIYDPDMRVYPCDVCEVLWSPTALDYAQCYSLENITGKKKKI